MSESPIGVFDSGVGGLSILNELRNLMRGENILYLADQAHVPYGSRTLEEIRTYSFGITQFLLQHGSKIIVVACNTASAASLYELRQAFKDVSFVGMEPAVKPAAGTTSSGIVGVLATPTTFQGKLFASVVERFAEDVHVIERTLPGMVSLIEAGEMEGPEVESILHTTIDPLLAEGVDTFVLACTHYPFIIPTLERIVGPDVKIIDPSPAIARQAQRILVDNGMDNSSNGLGAVQFFTSGNPHDFFERIERLSGEKGMMAKVTWEVERLSIA